MADVPGLGIDTAQLGVGGGDYGNAPPASGGGGGGIFNIKTGKKVPAPRSSGGWMDMFNPSAPQDGVTNLPNSWDGQGANPGSIDETLTSDQYRDRLHKMSVDEVKSLQDRLKRAGFDVRVTGHVDPDTESAFAKIVGVVQQEQEAQPDSKLTVDSYIDDLIATNDSKNGGRGAASGPETTHSKSSSIDLTDPFAARALIEDAITNRLGRRPRQDEIDKFTSALNQQEQNSPVVTEQTQHTDNGYNDANGGSPANRTDGSEVTVNNDESTTRSGGVTPQGFTSQYLQNNYADEQAGVDNAEWFNLALQILSHPSTGG
jgi:hypothetical protein